MCCAVHVGTHAPRRPLPSCRLAAGMHAPRCPQMLTCWPLRTPTCVIGRAGAPRTLWASAPPFFLGFIPPYLAINIASCSFMMSAADFCEGEMGEGAEMCTPNTRPPHVRPVLPPQASLCISRIRLHSPLPARPWWRKWPSPLNTKDLPQATTAEPAEEGVSAQKCNAT